MIIKPRKAIYRLLSRPYLYLGLATLLDGALVALGAWLHIEAQHLRNFLIILGLLLLTAFVDILIKKFNERGKISSTYDTFIDHLMKVAAVTMLGLSNASDESLRVNVMLPDEDERILSIHFAYGFKDNDPDRYINIPINAGCAGQAWLHKCATLADTQPLFDKTVPVHWGLEKSEIERIKPTLKCIFSIPILSGTKRIGVLNFDSDNEMSVMKFDDPTVQQVGFSFASILAIALKDRVA